jgi:hypothetical protein
MRQRLPEVGDCISIVSASSLEPRHIEMRFGMAWIQLECAAQRANGLVVQTA